MTNVSTIEDVFANVLGVILGASPGTHDLPSPTDSSSSTSTGSGSGSGAGPDRGASPSNSSGINPAYRPGNVVPGGRWLIPTGPFEFHHTTGWWPDFEKNAMTFYRWIDQAASSILSGTIQRVTVYVGLVGGSPERKTNSTDPNADTAQSKTNPVIAIGGAWEQLLAELPAVMGPGTSFDPATINGIREVIEGVAAFGDDRWQELQADLVGEDTKSPEFSGSAEDAWRNKVDQAMTYFGDLKAQKVKWDQPLKDAEVSTAAFVDAMNKAVAELRALPPGNVWQHPYRVIAAMFNGARIGDNQTDRNKNGGAWGVGFIEGMYGHKDAASIDWNEFWFEPPGWIEYGSKGYAGLGRLRIFHPEDWEDLDYHLRGLWVKHITTTFAPVVRAAADLVAKYAAAAEAVTLKPPGAPPPSPLNGHVGEIPNSEPPFPNGINLFPNGFSLFPNGFSLFPNDINLLPNGLGLPNGGSLFPNGSGLLSGGGLPNGDSLFPNGVPSYGPGGLEAAARLPADLIPPPSATGPSLGDLTPSQLQALQQSGQLDGIPLTAEQLKALDQAGLGAPGARTLGDLTPEQLGTLQRQGLLDNVSAPLASLGSSLLASNGLGPGGVAAAPIGLPSLATSPFPTPIDGANIAQPITAPRAGVSLGDVSGPKGLTLPGGRAAVGTGGFHPLDGTRVPAPAETSPWRSPTPSLGAPGAEPPGTAAVESAEQVPGRGGMPFMPPMMGGGAGAGSGQGERERQRNTWLTEDEEVWGTDPECAPAVIGRQPETAGGHRDEELDPRVEPTEPRIVRRRGV
jgi:hypothetical protein